MCIIPQTKRFIEPLGASHALLDEFKLIQLQPIASYCSH